MSRKKKTKKGGTHEESNREYRSWGCATIGVHPPAWFFQQENGHRELLFRKEDEGVVISMRKGIKDMKKGSMLIIFVFCLIHGCLQQENVPEPVTPQVRSQCVTPIQSIPIGVSPGGISTIPDGSLFGVAACMIRTVN